MAGCSELRFAMAQWFNGNQVEVFCKLGIFELALVELCSSCEAIDEDKGGLILLVWARDSVASFDTTQVRNAEDFSHGEISGGFSVCHDGQLAVRYL